MLPFVYCKVQVYSEMIIIAVYVAAQIATDKLINCACKR